MTTEQLKELEKLNERWANEHLETSADFTDLAASVMDIIPDVLAHIKQLTAERDAAQRAVAELNECVTKWANEGFIVINPNNDPRADCGKGYHHDREWEVVVGALDRLMIHAIEFYGDWNKGDFRLSQLAQCDMLSMAEQFAQAKQALSHAEKLTEGK